MRDGYRTKWTDLEDLGHRRLMKNFFPERVFGGLRFFSPFREESDFFLFFGRSSEPSRHVLDVWDLLLAESWETM